MIVVSRFSETNHIQGNQLRNEYRTGASKPGQFLYHKTFMGINPATEKNG